MFTRGAVPWKATVTTTAGCGKWLWALLLIPTTGAMATEIMTKDRCGTKERKSKHLGAQASDTPNPTVNMGK